MKTPIFYDSSSFTKETFGDILNYFLNNLRFKSAFKLKVDDNFRFFKFDTNPESSGMDSNKLEICLHNGNDYGTPNPGHIWIKGTYKKETFSYCEVLGIDAFYDKTDCYSFIVTNDETLEKVILILNSIIEKS